MLITRRLGQQRELAADDALRALADHDWTRERGGLLAYYPVSSGNPFQALLYSRLRTAGLAPVPTYDTATTKDVAAAVAGSGLDFVVHVHWLNFVLAKAKDEVHARELSKRFLDGLAELRELGVRLMWTVHNVLPHETRFPELDAELRQGMVAAAERVHVMSPRTRELVAPWFDIPKEKLLSVPHPAYHGAYPSFMTREQARAELGIAGGTTVFLLLGRVQPYKGLTELLDAFDRLCERDPGRHALLVAGPPGRDPETHAFQDRMLTHPAAYASLGKIPDEEMQLYLRAADVAVFPYRRPLNSGALALALTFGLPVVIRDDDGAAPHLPSSYAVHYDGTGPDGLLDALHLAGRRLTSPQARAGAVQAAARIAPARVGGAFAAAVRTWLDSGGSTP